MPIPIEELRESTRNMYRWMRSVEGWRELDPLPVVDVEELFTEEISEADFEDEIEVPVVEGTAEEVREDSNGYIWCRTPENPEWRQEAVSPEESLNDIQERIGRMHEGEMIDGIGILEVPNPDRPRPLTEPISGVRRPRPIISRPVLDDDDFEMEDDDFENEPNENMIGEPIRRSWDWDQVIRDPENQPHQFNPLLDDGSEYPIGQDISLQELEADLDISEAMELWDIPESVRNTVRNYEYHDVVNGKRIDLKFDRKNVEEMLDAELQQSIMWNIYIEERKEKNELWGFL